MAAGAPFDKRDGWIWFDGKLVPWADANLHVLSHGLHYASCVFEGERAYGGTIFKSTLHSERLKRSGEMLDFTIPYSIQEIDAAKHLVLEKNGLKDAYLRPVAWRGSEMMGVSAQPTNSRLSPGFCFGARHPICSPNESALHSTAQRPDAFGTDPFA